MGGFVVVRREVQETSTVAGVQHRIGLCYTASKGLNRVEVMLL